MVKNRQIIIECHEIDSIMDDFKIMLSDVTITYSDSFEEMWNEKVQHDKK